MSALVHMPNNTRIKLHLKPEPLGPFEAVGTRSKFGVEFRTVEGLEAAAVLLSGKDAGQVVTKIGPNQRAVLTLGTVEPYKYQAICTINPAFNAVATVVGPGIMEPKEEVLMDLVINAHREVNLEEFGWFCRIYLFE